MAARFAQELQIINNEQKKEQNSSSSFVVQARNF